MKVLITGGAGFIGSNIAGELADKCEVRILDNLSSGKISNIEDIKDRIEIIIGDIRDIETVKDAVSGVDFVLHHAALTSVQQSIDDPTTTNDINIGGTLNVLNASRDHGVKKIVFSSSASIYGDNPALPVGEDAAPDPLSPYAVSKLTGEHYCRVFYEVYGMETVSLRYFNIYGPRQDPASQYAAVIPKFIKAMLEGTPLTIYGDGTQTRDFTFIKDVVHANLRAIKSKKCAGKVYNIANGERTGIGELVELLNEIMNIKKTAHYTDSRPGDIKHSLADITAAKKELGYSPGYGLKEGLNETTEWFRGNV